MITFTTGTTDRTPGAWYLDHEVIDGVLTLRCDAAKLDDAHLTTSITTAIWTVDGVKYHTVRTETLPGEGKTIVYAEREEG